MTLLDLNLKGLEMIDKLLEEAYKLGMEEQKKIDEQVAKDNTELGFNPYQE